MQNDLVATDEDMVSCTYGRTRACGVRGSLKVEEGRKSQTVTNTMMNEGVHMLRIGRESRKN
jgi:hypothetical protein